MQRGHAFAIVDEVDSILIDEARTPLIISGGHQVRQLYERGPCASSPARSRKWTPRSPKARHGDFEMDEAKTAPAAPSAVSRRSSAAGHRGHLCRPVRPAGNHLQQALKAQYLFHRDKRLRRHNGEVMIVDEFTGRIMEGRRYSEGLHQAIEAKEGVLVREENQTLATITFQNYFRLYDKLSGMTGTA